MQVFVCTSWEKVKELMVTRVVHILLLDESCLSMSMEELDSPGQVLVLTRRKEAECIQGCRAVYKYQHVDRILAAVFAGISFLVLSRLGKRQENGRKINLKFTIKFTIHIRM